MKHIYLIDYYNPLQNNGLNSYVAQLTKQITKNRNIQLHIIWANAPFSSEIKTEIIEKVEHIYLPFDIAFQNKINENDHKLAVFLTEKSKKQSNVIFHFNWINHGAFAFLLKQQVPHCKTLLTKHCVPWRDFITSNYSFFFKIYSVFEQRQKLNFVLKNKLLNEITCYSNVDHIITVTYDAQNVLHQLFEIPTDKITTIYNGINLQEINARKTKKQLRKKYKFLENEKIVLFAGTLHPRKGVAELIQAFEKLSQKDSTLQYRLVICGKGDYDWIYKQIHQYLQITLTGNLSKEQLYEFYILADVGVVSSYAEQCSYTAIEMMASKLPIVVTDVGGLNELIDNQSGLKTHIEFTSEKIQFNIDDLAEKIHQSLTNTQLTEKQVEKAFQKVKTTLTAEKMAKQTLQVYDNILEQPEIKPIIDQTELVSVIIPCYNAEKYIEDCLQSVLNQSYKNIEVLLIDDASEDKTLEIVSKINDSRLKILQNTTNKGIVYALNEGVSQAKGTYIARLDSDDLMQPDRITKQVSFLRENQEYAMVGTNHILIDEKGNMFQHVPYPETNEEIRVFKYFLNPISHPTTMFRASIFKEFQYDNEYLHCEDYSLWFKIAEKYKIINLSDYDTLYRVHKNNLSSKNYKQQEENTFSLILDELEKLGLELSKEEIKIHGAIFTKKGKQYFNSPEKIVSLKKWIYKILKVLKDDNKVFKETLLQYCEIWEWKRN